MTAAHVDADVMQAAVGALEAQRVIDGIQSGTARA